MTARTHRLVAIRMPTGIPVSTVIEMATSIRASVRIVSSHNPIIPMTRREATKPTVMSRCRDACHETKPMIATIIHHGTQSSDSSTYRNTSVIWSLTASKMVPNVASRNLTLAFVHSRSGIWHPSGNVVRIPPRLPAHSRNHVPISARIRHGHRHGGIADAASVHMLRSRNGGAGGTPVQRHSLRA